MWGGVGCGMVSGGIYVYVPGDKWMGGLVWLVHERDVRVHALCHAHPSSEWRPCHDWMDGIWSHDMHGTRAHTRRQDATAQPTDDG